MPSLQVRDLPAAIHSKLAERAAREHRTLSQKATVLLVRALDISPGHAERRRSILDSLKTEPLVSSRSPIRPPEDPGGP